MTAQSQELTLREKTDQVVATLLLPAVQTQIEELLPEDVTLARFNGVAKSAIRTTPELVNADQTSLFGSILRCAQDGLMPDGREAALVIYKGKVSYLPMIGGVRKIAAVFGWAIRTSVVYANDDFDYFVGSPPVHHPVRPGLERGEMIAAYAVATHRDARRLEVVLHPEDIAKRRAKAQTDKVWAEWPAAMWEKTAGHAIFKQLPLDPNDVRVARMLADEISPAEQLYGVADGAWERVDIETGEITAASAPPADDPHEGADASGEGQQAETAEIPLAAVSVPGDDDEPEPGPARSQADELAAAAAVVGGTEIPNGNYQGMTLADVRDLGEEGVKWFAYVLPRASKYDDAFHAAVVVFVQGFLPELYAEWVAKAAA